MTTLTGVQMAATAFDAGFDGDNLYIACAVAHAESGWRTDARLFTSQEDSRGLFQINTFAHPDADKNQIYDPVYNAKYAYALWRRAGWQPWTTYTRGTYRLAGHWNPAVAAVQALASLGWNVSMHPPDPTNAAGGGGTVGVSAAVAQFSWGAAVVAQVAQFNSVNYTLDGMWAVFQSLYT